MVTRAALELEIDARRMKQGAAEAEKAIVSVGEGAKRTAREVKISTETIERKLDAIVEGMIIHNNQLGESNMQLRKIAEGVEKSMVKAEATTRTFGREVNTVGGVADAVEKKFAALGKAAVGMFAADIAAKVLGFNSAMDVLNKTSQAVADEIKGIVDGLRGMDDAWKKNIASGQRLFEIAAKLRAEEEGKKLVYNENFPQLGMNATVDLSYLSAYPDQFNAAAKKAAQIIEDIRTAEEGYRVSDEGGRVMMRDTAQMLIESLRQEIMKAASEARMRAIDPGIFTVAAPPGYVPDPTEEQIAGMNVYGGSAFARSTFSSGRNSPTGQYEDARRRMLAAEAEARRARMIGLNTGAGAAYGQGGIPDSRWDFGLGYMGGGGFQGSQDTMPGVPQSRTDAWLRGDVNVKGDTGYIGALQNRYSPERIAEQFSANFYQSLEASVMTGDFSNFGRSVMQMIGQSLMESIVAAPIQEAMGVLMQALLGNLRGNIGGGGAAVGAGYSNAGQAVPPGAPMGLQAGGTSTSVAPYRSGKQRYDDLSRRNLR